MSLDGLGLAYTVNTTIASVDGTGPAGTAGVQAGDVITAVQFYASSRDGKPEPLGWSDLEREQGAHALWAASEDQDSRQLALRVTQANGGTLSVLLEGKEDSTWPVHDRGLVYDVDSRLQRADSLVQALALGTKRTGRLISQIYQTLLAFFSGRIEFKKNASGPIAIAMAAYNIAGESLALFSLFLGMISANLAVINFLPIPILDGGHMVYLIYEKVRGRPMPEQVRIAATFVGLILICSLMLFVIYLDLKNRL
jgi:regulator of sigma E protease